MKLFMCPLLFFSVLTTALFSQAPAGDGNTPPDISPSVVESSDEETAEAESGRPALHEGLRDPFWPVGFSPKAEAKEEATQAIEDEKADLAADEELWNTLQKRLRVAGVAVVGDKKMATINNRLVEEGGVVGIRHENREFRWKISEITDSRRVRFTRLDIVPLP